MYSQTVVHNVDGFLFTKLIEALANISPYLGNALDVAVFMGISGVITYKSVYWFISNYDVSKKGK